MKKSFRLILISLTVVSFVVSISSCTRVKKDFSVTKGGDIWFRSPEIHLQFDPSMKMKIFYKQDINPLNISGKETQDNPGHFVVVNGEEVTNFVVNYDSIAVQPVETEFGKGKKLILKGVAKLKDGTPIGKTLTVELYDKYPDAVITSVTYKNLGTSNLNLDQTISNYFIIDSSVGEPNNKPYALWSFQGSSLSWGLDNVIYITDGFKQENWMGVQPETKTGGGLPFVDLWNKKAGLAIAHLDPKPQLVSFPVQVEADKKVSMCIQKELNQSLASGESYQTLKTVFIAHSLDYFDPLNTYSKLMADQGIKKEQPSAESYLANWCGWGYLTNFTLDDIYGTLPKLKELGIKWVVIDDRWWDKYGDWNLRKYTFPGGEKQLKQFVDSLHHQGFKVKIWWAPTPVQPEVIKNFGGSVDPGEAQVVKNHPDWLIMDKDGNYPRDCRDMVQLCPGVPEVQEYMKTLTTRFLNDWGFDGHKLDAYYVVPPCYNPAHHHKHPEESYQDLPELLKAIYETSKAIKPYSVTEICNCGTTQDFYQSVYTDQPGTSDPTSQVQQRQRVKIIKALWGANAPAYTDHVEHIRIDADMNDKSDTAKVGQDFATAMGCGGVIGTKFTWPNGPQYMQLTGEREKHWQKWFKLYNEKMLCEGNYLNLYDVVYDKPESHVIQKGDKLYYAFYAGQWQGPIELRGLGQQNYKVYDYDNQVDLGTVTGPVATFSPTFKEHLLIECTPVK